MVVNINYKTEEEISALRRSNQIVGQVLAELRTMVRPGVRTKDLDAYAESRARELGTQPAFKGYRGFPASLCTSVNEVIIHGLPSERVLREGDIIGLDFGVLCEGFYGDAAVTYPVGAVEAEAGRLMAAAEQSFFKGLEHMREGRRISDISYAIQSWVEAQGFSVIREFVGHGIGRALHEEPQVPNFGVPGRGPLLERGMTLALEPMLNVGGWQTKVGKNNWTVSTDDGSLSAHYEHTIAITEGEAEVLTKLQK